MASVSLVAPATRLFANPIKVPITSTLKEPLDFAVWLHSAPIIEERSIEVLTE